jgi:hypothetical protein
VSFWIIDPTWLHEYLVLLKSMPYSLIYTSTIDSFIASIFHTKIFYISAIVLIFFVKPILRILENEGRFITMNIALLESFPLSPFGFTFDQIIILPSIVRIIASLWNHQIPGRASKIIIVELILFYLFVISL